MESRHRAETGLGLSPLPATGGDAAVAARLSSPSTEPHCDEYSLHMHGKRTRSDRHAPSGRS